MRQQVGSTLVQIMDRRIFGQNHYLSQCWIIVKETLRNKFKWNCNQSRKLFIHENASENVVCEMAAILSIWRWVKQNRCLSAISSKIIKCVRSLWSRFEAWHNVHVVYFERIDGRPLSPPLTYNSKTLTCLFSICILLHIVYRGMH